MEELENPFPKDWFENNVSMLSTFPEVIDQAKRCDEYSSEALRILFNEEPKLKKLLMEDLELAELNGLATGFIISLIEASISSGDIQSPIFRGNHLYPALRSAHYMPLHVTALKSVLNDRDMDLDNLSSVEE